MHEDEVIEQPVPLEPTEPEPVEEPEEPQSDGTRYDGGAIPTK